MVKKSKVITFVVVGLLLIACILWGQYEVGLNALQQNLLAELRINNGTYDNRSLVLQNTSKAHAEELAEQLGASLRITSDGRFAALTLPDGCTIEDVVESNEYRHYLNQVSIDYQVKASELTTRLPVAPTYNGNDSGFTQQNYLGYLNMGAAWDHHTGSGVTVAVIDTGIDTDHPEFAGRISEYSYNATEDKIVKDYLLENGSYDWSLIEDEQGHGTAVTGVIAASMNNGGIVGIAPNVNIIVIKAEYDENGNFLRASDLVFGLYYAIERDAQVVNMSFGTPLNIFTEAVQLAYDSDVICVAAAGNDSTAVPHYPAACEYVIGVGALDMNSWELADYSNYGDNTNVVAPGSTYTTALGGGYQVTQGTSLSAPQVAGAAALFMQNNPYTTFDKVTEVLYASGYDLGDLGRDWYYGFGALDISAFLLKERGTVTFEMLTDEVENENALFIRGHALQELPEPERLYAVFDGWYYDDTLTQEYEYYTDAFTGDITLYAKWVNEEDGIPYTYVILDDGTVEIRSYTGHRRFITIPEKIEGRIVSSIGDSAFAGQTRLREVTLPDGLTNIGRAAFEGCADLVSIHIPDGVIMIGESAFANNVRLSTVSFKGNSALTAIGKFAFSNCGSLTTIELPADVSKVDGSAFFGATSLERIAVQQGNNNLLSKNGVLYSYDGAMLIAYPAAYGNSYELPENCVNIGNYAFAFANLRTIDLKNVHTIGSEAFRNAALEELTIPDNVVSMGASVFAYNTSLSQVVLGRSLTEIPEEAFLNCVALRHISIPVQIESVGASAFSTSGLRSVEFAEDAQLSSIGTAAFAITSLEIVRIPNSVVSVGAGAFSYTPLTQVQFDSSSVLATIGNEAFYACHALTQIEFPGQLGVIGSMAFARSGLTSVAIPANVTELGIGVFAYCQDLTDVTVASDNAVYTDLNGVVYEADRTVIHTYPAGKDDREYTIDPAATAVESYAFAGVQNLHTVTLPESMVELREYAFHAAGLQSMQIPDNVLQISRYTFAECWNLASVTFNDTARLPRLSYAAFAYSGLTGFRVPANVSTMAQGVFEGCKLLTEVTFAQNSKLESVSAYMFRGCNALQSIVFEPGSALTSIQAHGLEGMDRLTNIEFGDAKVTNVDNFAFRFCTSLTNINLPDTVESIGRYAFYGCENMTSITLPENVEHIGSYAFLGTTDLELYLTADCLPAYLDENWDHGIAGYYVGVTDIQTVGDFRYAILSSGNIAILEYLGSAEVVDLTVLELGGTITAIGGGAFADSTVTTVFLPHNLQEIQAEAFARSALQQIVIPASVRFIGREAFTDTPLERLEFSPDAELTVIEQYAFSNTGALTNVSLPASLTTMGTGVFQKSGLISVEFADGIGLTEIPKNAFAGTHLTCVDLPDSVTLVNHNAFNGIQTLTQVSFGNAESIRLMSNAFYHTGLTELHIPANVTYIGEYCFVALTELTGFTVDENNPNYTAVDGLLMNKSGRKLIAVPAGRTGSLTVPRSVEEIGFGAFEESQLSQVLFLEDANILSLGYRAFFKANNLTEITVPASVVSVDYYAFAYCENLRSVNFAQGNQLTGIYEGAFCGDISLEELSIPDSIVEISDFAFYGCSALGEIPISEASAVKGIYDYAFAYTGLSGELTTPETLIDIGKYAFMGTKVEKVTIPDSNKKELIIGIGAFEDCEYLEEITLPFIGASFEDYEISWFGYIFGAGDYTANETYVPKSLKTVTISEGISYIGIGGFANCTGLEAINLPEGITKLYNNAFLNTTAEHALLDPVTAYWDDGWSVVPVAHDGHFGRGITGKLIIDDKVDINQQATMLFSGCRKMEEVVLPESTTEISFFNCSSLRRIEIPQGVTEISTSAFYGCSSLTEIILPEGLVSIGQNAFCETSLTKIELPSTLASIGQDAFSGCNLYEIVNHSDLPLTIGSYDSYGCIAQNARVIIDADGNKTYRDGVHSLEFIDTEDGLRFVKENDTYKLLAYIGNEAMVRLPENINGHDYVLDNFGGVNTLILPGEMKKVPDYMFYGSTVQNFILEEGIEEIGVDAFGSNRSLKSVTLPNSLKVIGSYAFENCQNAERINIPDGVTEIGSGAFNCCYRLTEIHIPKNLKTLRSGVFQWCFDLDHVEIPDSVEIIENHAFSRCEKLREVVMSRNVTTIGDGAFSECTSLKSITLPQTLTNIGSGAFPSTANIVMIGENENYRYIDGIFYDSDMTRIIFTTENIPEDVVLPDTVTSIPAYAFQNNSVIRSIVIPKGVTILEDGVFQGSSLERIELPEGLITVAGSFEDCDNLSEIILPDGLQTIGGDTFRFCDNLFRVEIPDTVSYIGGYAFSECSSLSKIRIPDGVKTIEVSTFNWTGITQIDIPDSVTQIGDSAFLMCGRLERITLPKNLQSIGNSAFAWCSQIKYIDNRSDLNLTFESSDYGEIAMNAKVIVDANGVTHYVDEAYDYELGETQDGFQYIRENGEYKLIGYTGNQETITLPHTIEGNEYQLWYFDGGKQIIIPEGWTEIGEFSFTQSATLKAIVFPQSLIKINDCAFMECRSLETVEFPENLVHIGTSAFLNCSSLRTVAVPDSVTTLGKSAFSGCTDLRSIKLPAELQEIPGGLLSGCSNLKEIDIPESVTAIGYAAFEQCRQINRIILPDGVTKIEGAAFRGCAMLESINIPNLVTYIGGYIVDDSGIFVNPEYRHGGALIVDGWLLDVEDDLEYLSGIHSIKNVAENVYDNCTRLKNPVLGCANLNLSNMETLIIPSIPSDYVELYSNLTLKNIVIMDTVGIGSLYNNPWLFSQLSDITFWMENEKEDLQWDANFPGWNNGNRVIYGDNWIWADFYDTDGTLLSSEPLRTSQIIRRPVVKNYSDAAYSYRFVGWDLDGDGSVDSIPATASLNIHAVAVYERQAKTYTVTFVDTQTGQIYSQEELEYGQTIIPPEDPVKEGVTFDGWIGYTEGMTVTGNMSFSAKWKLPVTSGWIQENNAWYYYRDGQKITGWLKDGGYWYYLNANGVMQTNWVSIGGKWYYMNKSGVMQTGWLKDGGYWFYLDTTGAMTTGWAKAGNNWYYMNKSGVMQTGWVKVNGYWYYMASSGAMETGWVKVNGYWYYMASGGAMETGWTSVNGKWYYLASGGAMQTGWLKDGNYWYYLDVTGAMVTGTQVIGGKTYIFNKSGVWIG